MKCLSSFLVLVSVAVAVQGGIFGEGRIRSVGSLDYGINSILLDLITQTVQRPRVQISPLDTVIVTGLSRSGSYNSGTKGYQYSATGSQALWPDLAIVIAALSGEDQAQQGHQVIHDVKSVRKSQVTEGIKTTQAIFTGKVSSGGSAGYQYGNGGSVSSRVSSFSKGGSSISNGGSSGIQSGGSAGYHYGVKKH